MFDYEQRLIITITAFDYAGNELKSYEYHIVTEMRSFGQNKKVNSDLGKLDSDKPVTVCDGVGNVWVAWQAGPVGNRDIYIGKLSKGTDNFSGSIKVTNNAKDQCNPAIAIDSSGKLYVVWQDNRNGNWDIYLSTSDTGTSWSSEVMVNAPENNQPTPVSNQINPAIVIDSQSPNKAHVVWQDDGAGNQDIYYVNSSDGFAIPAVSQSITSNTSTSDQIEPAVAVDSANTVYVVWTDGRNGSSDIYGAASNNSWTNVAVVSNTHNQTNPVIAAEATGIIIHLLWVDDTPGDKDIYYASSNGLPGSPLTGSSIVDELDTDQLQPTIAVKGSTGNNLRVFACWQDSRNVNTNYPDDTDLYFSELSSGLGTNIFVGDGGTNSYQGEPAIGVCELGFPYVVWADGRSTNTHIYYAGSTFIELVPLWSEIVSYKNDKNAIYGVPEGHLRNPGDISIKVPPRAFPCDVLVNASKIRNSQKFRNRASIGQYEFGPSGIQFGVPITVTIAYEPLGVPVEVYWYDPANDKFRQDGITNVTHIDRGTIHLVRFKTRHFTPFYLVEGDSAPVVGGGGGGGGGCSVSQNSHGNVIEYMLPYIFYIVVLLIIKLRDSYNRRVD
jgi:hypothetical protein